MRFFSRGIVDGRIVERWKGNPSQRKDKQLFKIVT